MGRRYKTCTAYALVLGMLASCGARTVNDLTCKPAEISSQPLNDLVLNVYLDGTPSMEGYVEADDSRYIKVLDEVFNMLDQTAPLTLEGKPDDKPTVNYLRLGEIKSTGALSQPLENGAHRLAIKREFYDGTGFPNLEVTQIDAAIASSKPNTLTVIVTDLYQKDQYANKVVSSIQSQLESVEQGAVGVVGVRSEFNGKVYTEALRGTSSFSYNSLGQAAHPFYILLIGRVDEVAFYMNDLSKRLNEAGFQDGTKLVLFSPQRLYKRTPAFTKQKREDFPPEMQPIMQVPENRMAYRQQVRVKLKESDTIQPLILKDEVTLPFELPIDPIENVFHPASLDVVMSRDRQFFNAVSKQFESEEVAAPEDALSVTDEKLNPENLSFSLNINPAKFRPPGIYFYALEAEVLPSPNSDSDIRSTWKDWSSDASDTTASTDGKRTHNLDDFLEGLASMTLLKMRKTPIPLGRYCYLVQPS